MSYYTRQERANNEINKPVHEAFVEELKALLTKYRAEITIRENNETYCEGMNVEFDGEYTKEGETIRPYSTMELGRMLTGTYVE